jgi:hypothetical protein
MKLSVLTAMAILAISITTSSHARTYYSDWGATLPDGGYWVQNADAQSYISAMAANGDRPITPNSIKLVPVGSYYNVYTPAVFRGVDSSGTARYTPMGLTQIGPGENNADYIIVKAIIERIGARRSGGYISPFTQGVAACQTAPANLSQEVWFASTVANSASQGLSYEYNTKSSGKLSTTVGIDFVGLSGNVTAEIAQEFGSATGTVVENSWTDSSTYTTKSTVGASVPAGTVGTPAVSTPVVTVYGLFKLGRIFFQGGTMKPYRRTVDGKQYFPVFSDLGTTANWWLGKIEIPASYLTKVPGYTGGQGVNWYLDSPKMTVAQYYLYCKGDIAARRYAPAMKASLCAAGIDKGLTCQ